MHRIEELHNTVGDAINVLVGQTGERALDRPTVTQHQP
jgi:hypothetical protein